MPTEEDFDLAGHPCCGETLRNKFQADEEKEGESQRHHQGKLPPLRDLEVAVRESIESFLTQAARLRGYAGFPFPNKPWARSGLGGATIGAATASGGSSLGKEPIIGKMRRVYLFV